MIFVITFVYGLFIIALVTEVGNLQERVDRLEDQQ